MYFLYMIISFIFIFYTYFQPFFIFNFLIFICIFSMHAFKTEANISDTLSNPCKQLSLESIFANFKNSFCDNLAWGKLDSIHFLRIGCAPTNLHLTPNYSSPVLLLVACDGPHVFENGGALQENVVCEMSCESLGRIRQVRASTCTRKGAFALLEKGTPNEEPKCSC